MSRVLWRALGAVSAFACLAWAAYLAFDWAAPTTTYGLAYGYSFRRDHSIDIELGKTPLGPFVAAVSEWSARETRAS